MFSQLVITMTAVLAGASPDVRDKLPRTLDFTDVRAVVVQHDGRWPPLDTVARDVVEDVTGTQTFGGADSVALLLAWTFDSQTWAREPLIRIGNAQLRAELALSPAREVYSYDELSRHGRLRELIDHLAHVGDDRKPDPLESKVGDINGKLVRLQNVFAGRVIRPVPDPDDPQGAWQSIGRSVSERMTPSDEPPSATAVRTAWSDVKTAFLADDGPAFAAATQRLTAALASLPAAYRPEPDRIATELRYNRLQPFRTAWMVMGVGAVLSAAALFVRRRAFDVLAILGLVAGFGMLTYGLWLRWHVAGRIPAANMFESLLFVSWGMGAFAILSMLVMNHRIVPLTASGMGALSLMLADCLPLDSFIRPIAPVLRDTVWMSIHVPIIMVSYSVLALAVLIAHAQLVTMAFAPGRRSIIRMIDAMHYWYVHVGTILLFVGIVTGSMWAASSWGRYWGWDPKEVWSLVAFLGYMAILHVRINHDRIPRWAYAVGGLLVLAALVIVVPKLAPLTSGKVLALVGTVLAVALFLLARGEFATAVKSVLAFWLIIMTYVGVNFVLGIGLHSYAFGTGAVAHYMFLLGGIDLAAVGLCCVVYLARRWPASPMASRSARAATA